MPRSLDDDIVALWKELNPSGAYLLGWDEYAGTLFIPSEQNIKEALEKVRGSEAEGRERRPGQGPRQHGGQPAAARAPARARRHSRGDIRAPHQGGGERQAPRSPLISAASKALDATQKRFKGVKVPVGRQGAHALQARRHTRDTRIGEGRHQEQEAEGGL